MVSSRSAVPTVRPALGQRCTGCAEEGEGGPPLAQCWSPHGPAAVIQCRGVTAAVRRRASDSGPARGVCSVLEVLPGARSALRRSARASRRIGYRHRAPRPALRADPGAGSVPLGRSGDAPPCGSDAVSGALPAAQRRPSPGRGGGRRSESPQHALEGRARGSAARVRFPHEEALRGCSSASSCASDGVAALCSPLPDQKAPAGSRQGLSFSAAPCFRRRRRCGGSGSLGSGTTHLFEATGRHVVPTVREGGGSASVKGVRGSVSAVVPGWFRLWARCRIRRGRGAEGLAVSVGMCMPECAREGVAAFKRRGSRGAVRQPAQGCRGAVEEPVRAVVPGVWRVTVRSLRRGRSGHRGGGTGARVDARWGQHARGSHPCRSRAAEPLRGSDGEGAAPAAAAVSPALREGYQHPGETGVSALGTRPVRASRERRRRRVPRYHVSDE